MKFIEHNIREFVKDSEHLYRRLSVRECARIQTFPDSFRFYYSNVSDAYKMIGNAVPVRLASYMAKAISLCLANATGDNVAEPIEQNRCAIAGGNLVKSRY